MLPTFIVAGAARSSTTSLNTYLSAHPDIFMSPIKETNFFSFVGKKPVFTGPFDNGFAQTIITESEAYEQLFDAHQCASAVGENSPSYLFFPEAAENIAKTIPDAKIIITLRNPVDRTFSHYLQQVMLGYENESFEVALAQEQERAERGWRWSYQYKQQSLYAEKVKRYFALFGRDNVSVHLFSDLRADPKGGLGAICSLLGVNDDFYETYDFKQKNQSGLPRNKIVHNFLRRDNFLKRVTKPVTSPGIRARLHHFLASKNYVFEEKPDMLEETKSQLKAFFQDDCLELELLLGRDLSKWHST